LNIRLPLPWIDTSFVVQREYDKFLTFGMPSIVIFVCPKSELEEHIDGRYADIVDFNATSNAKATRGKEKVLEAKETP